MMILSMSGSTRFVYWLSDNTCLLTHCVCKCFFFFRCISLYCRFGTCLYFQSEFNSMCYKSWRKNVFFFILFYSILVPLTNKRGKQWQWRRQTLLRCLLVLLFFYRSHLFWSCVYKVLFIFMIDVDIVHRPFNAIKIVEVFFCRSF